MRKTAFLLQILIAIVVPSVFGIERGSLLRFHKLLHEYDNPAFRANDRDIFTDVDYSAEGSGYKPQTSSLDVNIGNYRDTFNMDFSGTAGVKNKRIRSSNLLQLDDSINLHINGTVGQLSSMRGNDLTGISDTIATESRQVVGNLSYNGALRRYVNPKWLHSRPVFIEAAGRFDAAGAYQRNQEWRRTVNERDDYSTATNYRSKRIYGQLNVTPAIGYGKRLPVAPLYKAFEIERRLKKCGALTSKLSDVTILKIAALIGSLKSFRIAHDRPDKYYMTELEQTLLSDPAVDTTRLNGFALFDAFETFSEPFPLLMHGFEVTTKVDAYFGSHYVFQSMDPPREWFDASFDINIAPLTLNWTFPVFSRFFLEYGARPDFRYYREPSRYSGNIGAYFFFTNRIVSHIAIAEIPLHVIIPFGKPNIFEFETSVYLEDNIILQLNCFKRNRPDYWHFEKNDPIDYRHDEGITLRVLYDF